MKGENGISPEIGENGNWWIDGVDTGKTAIATDGEDGEDGDGIVGITVNEDNFLVIDMKFGADIVIEKSIVGAAGEDGEDGKDGNGIKSITLNADDELVIETDNDTITLGPIRGETGAKGTGIKAIALNDNFELVFTMDDAAGTTHTVAGSLKGADGVGVEEVKIEDGILKIKYTNSDTFVELGNVKGDPGEQGPQGPQGPAGNDGVDGKSAYDIAVKNGFEGTETEWLASLAGRGIVKTEISGTNFIVHYTDGTTETHDLSSLLNHDHLFEFMLLEDGTLSVSAGPDIGLYTEVVIPETYRGRTVSAISTEGFKNIDSLKIITVPNTITVIGAEAFYDCDALEKVKLSETITAIPDYCFYSCDSLSGVEIPNNVSVIKSYAFENCTALEEIKIPEAVKSINRGAFVGSNLSKAIFEDQSSTWRVLVYNLHVDSTNGSTYSEALSVTNATRMAELLTYVNNSGTIKRGYTFSKNN